MLFNDLLKDFKSKKKSTFPRSGDTKAKNIKKNHSQNDVYCKLLKSIKKSKYVSLSDLYLFQSVKYNSKDRADIPPEGNQSEFIIHKLVPILRV